MRRLVARLPVRVRVTLAFAAVMAVLLAALGSFLYLRLDSTLDATVDRGLRSRAGDLLAIARQSGPQFGTGRSPITERGESLAQVLDTAGDVLDAPPALRDAPLLSPAELRRATRRTIFVDHRHTPTVDSRVRLLGAPVTERGRRLIVVVGASLEPSEDALRRLGGLLLIGFPFALLLASLAGYGAATGALRPVEAMSRQAREIQADRQGQRLPVPEANDEVRRLGETLNEMLARIEAAFSRERRFVADASHELRTPLAILRGELELALRDAGDVEDFRESVASAAEEADRLSQLAEDLLVIARADQGSLPVRLENIDAAGLLGSLEQRFAQRAGAHGVEVEARRPSRPLHLTADVLRMEQALGNLVDNALRHGGGTVELVAHPRGDSVHLHVLDDGPGFPEEFLPGAFERFSRGDPARGRGGAGLGLAIVQAIAEAHGGQARARNRPEGGADVWLELPRAPSPAAPAAAPVPG